MDRQGSGHVATCGGDSKRHDHPHAGLPAQISQDRSGRGDQSESPDLTIWGNKIEAVLFIGIHYHYANLALRMLRASMNCLIIAFCHDIHEDAMLSVQDLDVKQLDRIIEISKTVRKELGIEMPKDGKTVHLTATQIRANHGVERVNPLQVW
jgi:hypothetical protein